MKPGERSPQRPPRGGVLRARRQRQVRHRLAGLHLASVGRRRLRRPVPRAGESMGGI